MPRKLRGDGQRDAGWMLTHGVHMRPTVEDWQIYIIGGIGLGAGAAMMYLELTTRPGRSMIAGAW